MTLHDKCKMGLIAGVISATAIPGLCIQWMLPAGSSAPVVALASAGIGSPAQVLPPSTSLPPYALAVTDLQTVADSTQPAPAATPAWETENRDTVIKMLTDGHIYAVGNQPAEAIATYDLLFQLIGTNVIQDTALQTLVAQAVVAIVVWSWDW